MPKENPQDRILNQLRKSKAPCTIHITNGFQLKNAIIRAFDSFVIVIVAEDGKQMMLYKHAVSSITMQEPITLNPNAVDGEAPAE